MAPNNKCGLINKVRRMRDAIDETTGASNIDHRSQDQANLNDFATLNGNLQANKVDRHHHHHLQHHREVKTAKQKLGAHSRQNCNHNNHNNYNIERKERIAKRINSIDETDELMLGPSSAQCTNAKALGFCGSNQQQPQQNHGTRIKRETVTQCKNQQQQQLETNLKDVTYTMPQHPVAATPKALATTTGADCNVGRPPGGEPIAVQNHYQLHHNRQQHYGPTNCQTSKLLVNDDNQHQNFRHHQPHCVFYNPSSNKQQQQPKSSKYLRNQSHKQQQHHQDKYLLVEYRPSRSELHHVSNDNNGSTSSSNGKRTTIKFISQLYFLLHLSAILSLLFYHKNLVTSESKWPTDDHAQQFYSGSHIQVKNYIANDTSTAPTTTTPIVNPLPVPQMLMQLDNPTQNRHQNRQNHIISSVVVAPNLSDHHHHHHGMRLAGNSYNIVNNINGNTRRFGRQTTTTTTTTPNLAGSSYHHSSQQFHISNPDILVRLVGPQHARHVLRYFLSYLLISSVVVLVCLRLFMLCNWRRAKRKFTGTNSTLADQQSSLVEQQQQQETESANYYHGFYHRTRLDCTPVLIGSISLGLIQLIVIGLDIAYNFDWLSENRWPANLPFLQFAFVSLLMQYILGKVAEKREQRKSCLDSFEVAKTRRLRGEDGSGSSSSSSGGGRLELDKRVQSISSPVRRYYNNNNNRSELSTGVGLENIALAHLLVTHILLWLMKLNSISLFQAAIEQHHQQQLNNNNNNNRQQPSISLSQLQQYDQQSIPNKLFPSIHLPSNTMHQPPQSDPNNNGNDLSLLRNQHIIPSSSSAKSGDSSNNLAVTNGRILRSNENRQPYTPHSNPIEPQPQPQPPPPPPITIPRYPVLEPRDKSRHSPSNTIAYDSENQNSPRQQYPFNSNRPPPPPISLPPPPPPQIDDESPVTLSMNEPPMTTTKSPEVVTATNELSGVGNKAERGLRSTLDRLGSLESIAKAPDPTIKSPNSRWAQHSPGLPRGLNVTPTSTTTTTTTSTTSTKAPELLAPQTNTNQGSASTGSKVPQTPQKTKTLLPKRMTAFRQRAPSSSSSSSSSTSAAAGSSVIASISKQTTDNSSAGTTTTTTTTTTSTTTTTTTTTPAPPSTRQQQNPKQRARVMIHRIEDPVHLDSLEIEAARGRRAKQVAHLATISTTTSRPKTTSLRPFPSVESDPPILIATTTPSSVLVPTTFRSTTMKAFVRGNTKSYAPSGGGDYETQATSSHSLAPHNTKTLPQINRPTTTEATIETEVEDEEAIRGSSSNNNNNNNVRNSIRRNKGEPIIGGAELTTTEEQDGGSGGGNGEDDIEESAEIDLDALLPPVPNYNESAESTVSAVDNAEDIVVKKPPIIKTTTKSRSLDANDTAPTAHKKAFDLGEDAFVFNEAASEIVNATSSAVADLIESNHLQPIHEALVMPQRHHHHHHQQQQQQQQRQQQNDREEPSFADYLMPIVHQYHILIVAVLFNMWLDGLRSGSITRTNRLHPPQATHAHQDISFSNKRLITSRDLLLASGSRSSSSGSSELIGAGGTISRSSSPGGLVAIPIKDNNNNSSSNNGKNRHFQPQTSFQGFALDQAKFHKPNSGASGNHWKHMSDRHHHHHGHHHHNIQHHPHHHHHHHHPEPNNSHHRTRSLESLHCGDDILASSSEGSTLSRRHSVRSTSSQQLLWVSGLRAGGARSPLLGRQVLAPFSLRQSDGTPLHKQIRLKSERHYLQKQQQKQQIASQMAAAAAARNQAANSVCSVFFGLIVVSISLIVILVSIDILLVATQCLTQLITIIVCLAGLLLIWRSKLRANNNNKNYAKSNHKNSRLCYKSRLLNLTEAGHASNGHLEASRASPSGSHRQCFHYLFLLAAYYCGISIALNLGKQHSLQQLFSQPVTQFIQRHFGHGNKQFGSLLSQDQPMLLVQTSQRSQSSDFMANNPTQAAAASSASFINYLFLFHLILVVKGLLLILQVTLQTVMIRSSCQRATKELRQIYTFLMFANLSLWALEICEQQQHLQRDTFELATLADNNAPSAAADRFKPTGLDGFNRFAASIVTLSHLYHGLVFMQQ